MNPCSTFLDHVPTDFALQSGLEQLAGTMDWVRRKGTGKDFTPSWPHPQEGD